MDNSNRILDIATLLNHLSLLTGVECQINESPGLKAMGLSSITAASNDFVNIAAKYGIKEAPTNNIQKFEEQYMRVLNKLSDIGIFNISELDRFYIMTP